ncbi:response regulator [Parasphingorhabdus sp. JC815]|uniref:hybrid sensor histidine kinase/response regulator n=1 Tax=Parasphingorhabdus sp. JC815 TaxID=3232140 RepID=UPI0034581CDF
MSYFRLDNHHIKHSGGHRKVGHHHVRPGDIVERSRNREREMIINRLVLIMIALPLAYLLDGSSELMLGFQLHLMGSLALMIYYCFSPAPSPIRRIGGLIVDFGVAVYLFTIGGGAVAAIYPLYLWVILGYGFRFGIEWLFIAAVLGTISFGWTVYTVPYWQENLSLSVGLLVGLMVVPAYCSTLIIKISKATKEAEDANKAKSLFLASVSHELRTPLNAIIGYGTHLLDMGLPEDQKKMIGTSVSAGQHLLYLINQLLTFARSDTQEDLPEPKEFTIVDVLTEVRDILQLEAADKGLQFHLQAEALSDQSISGQLDYIRNILINLTSNAIKFTETGAITLKCGINDKSGVPHLWCSVTDTGPGIPEEAHEKIFGVFQQADDSIVDNFGGTGLGLAICKQLAVQAGGDISLKSTVGEGSSFTLTCPIDLVASDEPAAIMENYRILSLGYGVHGPNISGSEASEVLIDHVQCTEVDRLESILIERQLSTYDLAVLDDKIAEQLKDDSSFWNHFRKANLPPVLLSHDSSKNLEEIKLRAAFASVLPASPDFDTVRSVIQIGCSFNRNSSSTEDDTSQIIRPAVSLNILVADDNRTNQMVLETILVNAGHKVSVVSDGEQALDELENQAFDIVFLDVNMPNIGGIECCKLWRQIEGPRHHVPIIGLTADSTVETEKKCLDAGMDLRLTKPIEAGALLDTVAEQTGNFLRKGQSDISDNDDPFNVVQAIKADTSKDTQPPIDMKQLDYLKSIGDDIFVQSVIDAYQEDMVNIMIDFDKSVRDHDVEAFRFQAHAFKSGANNIGATKLAEMCGKLEVITEAKFIERSADYLTQIEQEVSRITNFLNDKETARYNVISDGLSSAR